MSLSRFRGRRATDIPSAAVALVLTAGAFAEVFVVSARTLLVSSTSPRLERDGPREALVYLHRPATATARAETANSSPGLRARTPKAPAPLPRERPPASSEPLTASPSAGSSALTGPAPVFLPPYRAQSRTTPSPFDLPRARNPFVAGEQRTRAELDSIVTEMSRGVPLLAKTRTATAAERDSLMREQSRSKLVPGRAAQMPGSAGASVGVPLFAAGPSAAERRRDSAANAEYVARLRRLQARANASRESLRVADSMPRRTTP